MSNDLDTETIDHSLSLNLVPNDDQRNSSTDIIICAVNIVGGCARAPQLAAWKKEKKARWVTPTIRAVTHHRPFSPTESPPPLHHLLPLPSFTISLFFCFLLVFPSFSQENHNSFNLSPCFAVTSQTSCETISAWRRVRKRFQCQQQAAVRRRVDNVFGDSHTQR